MEKTTPKIAEIADRLGVSRSTVSYVLNDKWEQRGISKATAEKILNYIEETGFLPNPVSLALKGKRVKEIAILVSPRAIEHQRRAFFSLLGILEEHNKSYMVLPLTEDSLPETAQFINMYRVPKVITVSTPLHTGLKEKWTRFFKSSSGIDFFYYEFPFEQMDPGTFLNSANSVAIGINRKKARQKALEYIISKGYKNIVSPIDIFTAIKGSYPKINFIEYELCHPEQLFKLGEFIAQQLPAIRKKTKGPLAVYVNDDLASASVMKHLSENGFNVPGDFAILSWDGLPESDYFRLPLSTMVIPHGKMLQTATDWINGKRFPQNQIVLDIEIREGKTLPKI